MDIYWIGCQHLVCRDLHSNYKTPPKLGQGEKRVNKQSFTRGAEEHNSASDLVKIKRTVRTGKK